MSLVQEVTPQNCFNDSNIKMNMIFTTLSLTNAGQATTSSPALYGLLSIVALVSTFVFIA